MDRRTLLLTGSALLLVSLSPLRSAADAATSTTFDQAAFDAALQSGKPVLVDISAWWCPTCLVQKRVLAGLLADPRYAELVVFDVNYDKRKDVVRAFGARSQSTLIVFADGKEVGRSVGDTRRASIEAMLAPAL